MKLLLLIQVLIFFGCAPTVRVESPSEPIEINLNVNIEHNIKVKIDKDVETLIDSEDDLF